ncbi:MAG: hypothetical protein QOH84_2777 [Kribbellaceae bacterium]|nr:hypothetical protein [Kribbellaceae bacterium]
MGIPDFRTLVERWLRGYCAKSPFMTEFAIAIGLYVAVPDKTIHRWWVPRPFRSPAFVPG